MASTKGYLRSMNHLEKLTIELWGSGNHATLLEKFEPPPSLKGLSMSFYNEAAFPSRWRGAGNDDSWATFLPNLVRVTLDMCSNFLHLPSMSKLLHLKSLSLYCMGKLEYIEDLAHNGGDTQVFFPSLEELNIYSMSKLKGWWRGENIDCYNCWQPCFPRLAKLNIYNCSNLTSFPACIGLEKLSLCGVHKELQILSWDKNNVSIKLREVDLDDLDYLKLLPTEGLISICINRTDDIESLSELEETFRSCLSLRSFAIKKCLKLRSLEGAGWEHLTALDALLLSEISSLTFLETEKEKDGDDDNNDGMPWRSIGARLRSLQLSNLDMETIPNGMRHLTSLENLTIDWCSSLIALPEWISCLASLRSLRILTCHKLQLNPGIVRAFTSLQSLEVRKCPLIVERFQDPDGEDWDELRHIPLVDIRAD